MEYLLGFFFTSKYIFGRSGNTDMYYLFSIFVLLFYFFKRKEKLKLIAKIMMPLTIICIMMCVFYQNINIGRCIIFFLKILLDITLFVLVLTNCKKWKMNVFVRTISLIHGIETIFALILPNSTLWEAENLINNADSISRLRLFYMDPGTMAFASGLVLVILVYLLINEEVKWHYILGIFVMITDLYLSYGLGGISCALVAIIFILIVSFISNRTNKMFKLKKNIMAVVITTIVLVVSVCLSSTYVGRIRNVFDGSDYMLNVKLIEPLKSVTSVLKETNYFGVGFGNGNTAYALNLIGSDKAYPNSFIRLTAEGGLFGILLILFVVIIFGYYCIKYGNVIDKALYAYVVLYQFIGGYFTDATNFLIYGWILGDCLNNKISITGRCKLKLLVQEKKDKLKIAMIGHKRIPSREGGVEIVVEELSKRYVKLGHEVDAYNRSGQNVAGKEFNVVNYDELKEYEGIKIIRIPTIQRKGIAAFVYSFLASIYVVTKDYDVVHYHAEGPCLFLWVPNLFGIRTVATIHGLDWQRTGKWGSFASSIIKLGEIIAVYFADEIIVLSKRAQNYFLDVYNRKTYLIPNGVNKPKSKKPVLIKKKYGLKGNDYYLALSRLTREKRIDLLIESFKSLKTDKKLVIAGGSSDSGEYVNYLHDLANGDDRIIFTGFVQGKELEELYSNAYVYCLPSELEGMPLSLLEAMSYGNCCLTSDIPECTDVTRNMGISFITNDVKSLTKTLKKLEDNQNLINKFKRSSEAYICNKYNWDDVVAKTLPLYQN